MLGVLLELISDLAPSRGGRTLTPEDPIERGIATIACLPNVPAN